MDEDARIEQFQRMTEADPENELGHFSLGKAYLDAGRYEEAVTPLQRAIELAAHNSRAYYLLANAQVNNGDKTGAIETLKKGFDVANTRGDLMPRNDMAAMLEDLGEKPPEAAATAQAPVGAAATADVGEGQIQCSRCGQVRPKMAERPFKGELGEQVWDHVCQSCFQEWIPMGTKVINELRLNFADPQHAQMYDQHMREFLGLR